MGIKPVRGVFALVAGCLLAGSSPAPEPPLDIYLLMGQSNMSGRGSLADLLDAERATDPRIFLYGNDGQWRLANDPLDAPANQLDAVSRDPAAAVGPGLFFARALAGQRRRAVGLMPCAKGGSGISEWNPGQARDTLYGSCLARAREATQRGRIAGILWYQGERDARTREQAEKWGAAFKTMMAALRSDLAAPRLPIVFVRLADAPGGETFPYWPYIQKVQERLRIDCGAQVSAAGLPRLPDGLHLTTTAQRSLGSSLASAMMKLHGRRRCR